MSQAALRTERKLALAQTLSPRDREVLNVVLRAVDFVYEDEEWKLSIQGGGRMPYKMNVDHLRALHRLLGLVSTEPPPE
jgi:hypothetical protein